MALTAEAIFIERAPDADGLQTRGLFLALQRLNRRIEQAVAAMQSVYGPEAANDPYRGLYIDHDEVSRLLTDEPGAARFQHGSDAEPLSAAGAWPRLARLQRAFGLSSVDADMLLIALAPELNPSYERLYAYLQNDVTRRRPSVNLALNLLYASFESKLVARQRFAPSAPLFKYQLLRLVDDPADHQPPLLSKYLTIDERVVNFLLGAEDLDARLAGYAQPTAPHDRIDDLLLPADVKRRLVRLTRRHGAGTAGLIFYFQGPYGAGKQTTAGALCRELGVGLLAIDGERLAQADGATFEATLRLALRETLLRGAACYLDGFDT